MHRTGRNAVRFGEEEIQVMLRQTREVYEWYNGMTNEIPSWYIGVPEL